MHIYYRSLFRRYFCLIFDLYSPVRQTGAGRGVGAVGWVQLLRAALRPEQVAQGASLARGCVKMNNSGLTLLFSKFRLC